MILTHFKVEISFSIDKLYSVCVPDDFLSHIYKGFRDYIRKAQIIVDAICEKRKWYRDGGNWTSNACKWIIKDIVSGRFKFVDETP
jgi:hypothetical protein